MKVLMFGWEFPPHISGGLGTACYGLTKGLKSLGDVELIFVVPKKYGDEDENIVKIIGASDIPVIQQNVKSDDLFHNEFKDLFKGALEKKINIKFDEKYKDMTLIEISSMILPYFSPEQYEKILRRKKLDISKVYLNDEGKMVYLKDGVEVEVKLDYTDIVETDELGRYTFSGKYGPNLLEEVAKYAEIASVIAKGVDFDVIHAHDWLTYAAGIAAKKVSGKPLVIHVHATEFDRSGENVDQRVYDIERMGMDNADRIITVSNLTKNIVINRYEQNPQKITTVYNAVEFNTSKEVEYKKNVKEKIVTFLGRVTYQKGPEYFVEAAYKVLNKVDNVRFVMAGSGDMLRKMIRRAAELRITDKFHFTDFLKGDDVKRMFAISDVYVMPSVSEPFGISPLEAMQTNVPTIISKQSGVAEILKHAIKIDFWDVNAMADAIYGLLMYDSLSKMVIKQGRDEVDSLKWDNAAYHVREVYKSAIKNQYYF